jgi:hypothetical protein
MMIVCHESICTGIDLYRFLYIRYVNDIYESGMSMILLRAYSARAIVHSFYGL